MEQIAIEVLRAVRGRRSQRALSRRLGYRSNPVALWETGRRFPTAAEVLRACQLTGVDVDAAIARFHAGSAHAFELSDEGVASWLRHLRGGTPIGAIAERAGVSRYAVGRWLAGTTRPRLPDFLRLIDAMGGRVDDLIAALVPIERVPALSPVHDAHERARQLSSRQPWTGAVIRMLETEAYASGPHRDGWIAERLGIDTATEREILDALLEAGIVAEEQGRYRVERELHVQHIDPETRAMRKQHWAEVARQRIARPEPNDYSAFVLAGISRDELLGIRERLRAVFREVLGDVTESGTCQTVALMNLHLVEWDPARAVSLSGN